MQLIEADQIASYEYLVLRTSSNIGQARMKIGT